MAKKRPAAGKPKAPQANAKPKPEGEGDKTPKPKRAKAPLPVKVRLRAGRTGFGKRGDIVEYDAKTAYEQQARGNCVVVDDPNEK